MEFNLEIISQFYCSETKLWFIISQGYLSRGLNLAYLNFLNDFPGKALLSDETKQ